MEKEALKEALSDCFRYQLSFDFDKDLTFEKIESLIDSIAQNAGYIKALPSHFKHKCWAAYLDPHKGLRWGYVVNQKKIGWFEGRITTALNERSLVIKNSNPVFAKKENQII